MAEIERAGSPVTFALFGMARVWPLVRVIAIGVNGRGRPQALHYRFGV